MWNSLYVVLCPYIFRGSLGDNLTFLCVVRPRCSVSLVLLKHNTEPFTSQLLTNCCMVGDNLEFSEFVISLAILRCDDKTNIFD